MFCMHCGKEIPDHAGFCSYCGKKIPTEIGAGQNAVGNNNVGFNPTGESVSQIAGNLFEKVDSKIKEKLNVQQDSFPNMHPFQKLGGFLAFLAYYRLFGAAVSAFYAIVIAVTCSQYGLPFLFTLAFVALFGLACYCNAKFFVMIQKKDPGFVRFREKLLLIVWGVAMLVFLAVYIYAKSVLGEYAGLIFTPVLIYYVMIGFVDIGGCVLELLYYGKSVRVRTYFGSDEYLRRSIFMHNRVYPVPAVPDRT